MSMIPVNDGKIHTIALFISDKLIHLMLDNTLESIGHLMINKIQFTSKSNYYMGGYPSFAKKQIADNFIGIMHSMSLANEEGQYSIFDFGKNASRGKNIHKPSDYLNF